MSPSSDDDRSSLERARERLYSPATAQEESRAPLESAGAHGVQHAWEEDPLKGVDPVAAHHQGRRHVRFAGIFFSAAFVFFLAAAGTAGYLFYYGGNTVSVNNVSIKLDGPNTVASGDTVSLSLSVTNQNPAAISNATIEIDFPDGTRSAADVTQAYPRYTENLGTIASGQTVTRTIKAVVFGGAGQALSLPISLSYGTAGSNAVFVKKSSYALAVSSTPLSVSISTLSEAVSGKPLTLTLTVRSNAAVPLQNVVVSGTFPFGFQVTHSSIPISGTSFLLGTMAPGETRTITLAGTLTGQDSEQRVFHFSVGTAQGPKDTTLALNYMTQAATVTIAAPFIATSLSLNGASSDTLVVAPGSRQSVSIHYTNTLPTAVTNASVTITISGSAVDYGSVRTTNGFYNSSTHSVVFSRDTDPSLANLAPGSSGLGTFTFATLAAGSVGVSPQITFTTSVSGTRIGQSSVPEQVSASATQVAKVQTYVALTAQSLHSTGTFPNTGPIPPQVDTPTTYTILWKAQDQGSAVAGATVTAILPSYVTFTNKTAGTGSISYDASSRTVTWNAGDLASGSAAQAAFQVSLTPSVSQKGSVPIIVGQSALSAYDRFAGVQVSSAANPVTTTTADPGFSSGNATVQ